MATEQWQQAEQADADAGGSTDQQAEQADESAAAEGAATEGAADRSDDSERRAGVIGELHLLLLLKVLLLKVPLTAAMTPRRAGVIGELHLLLQALNPSRRSVRCWCQGSARIATAVRETGTAWQPLSSRRGPEKAWLEAGLSGLCWGSRRCERARWISG